MVPKRRGPYRHHPLAIKRAIVEESLQPGASVAQIARKHGVNANQVFLWRKTYREGLLPDAKPTLLPVTLSPLMIRLMMAAARLPARRLPANSQFLRPVAIGRMQFSIQLLSIGT